MANTVIDLFCGCGGLSLGFQQAGFEVVAGVDHDPDCAMFYARNIAPMATYTVDLKLVTPSELKAIIRAKRAKVVIGAPSTKPFSASGKHLGELDPRNCVGEFFEHALAFSPDVILLDTVKAFLKPAFGHYREGLLRQVAEAGYDLDTAVLNAYDYGVPQRREHAYIVAMRKGTGLASHWRWPAAPSSRTTMIDVLAELLPTLPEAELQDWLKPRAPGLEEGPVFISGKNRNERTPQWVPLNGPCFTLTESAGSRHRVRDASGQWRLFTPDCFRRVQGFPDAYAGVDQDVVSASTPPALAAALARSVAAALTAM